MANPLTDILKRYYMLEAKDLDDYPGREVSIKEKGIGKYFYSYKERKNLKERLKIQARETFQRSQCSKYLGHKIVMYPNGLGALIGSDGKAREAFILEHSKNREVSEPPFPIGNSYG